MQHSQTNVLIFILQIAILICTMGLWTFGAGYLILFEKESDDPERDIKGEWDTRSIRDKGTMAGLAAQFAGMGYCAAPPIRLGGEYTRRSQRAPTALPCALWPDYCIGIGSTIRLPSATQIGRRVKGGSGKG